MVSKQELLEAIQELEEQGASLQTLGKLSTLYTVLDHCYQMPPQARAVEHEEEIIGDYGDSYFLQAVRGKDAYAVWQLIDELVSTLEVLEPRLHSSFINKLEQ